MAGHAHGEGRLSGAQRDVAPSIDADGLVHPSAVPVVDLLKDQGHDGEAFGNLFGAIDALRIPVGLQRTRPRRRSE